MTAAEEWIETAAGQPIRLTADEQPIRLTADEVRAVKFRRPARLHRGYDEEQVDIFLDWVADSLDRGEPIPAATVHNATFGKPGLNRRGYREDDVDEFLRLIERALTR
jgi:DivIVA domain-containing protein